MTAYPVLLAYSTVLAVAGGVAMLTPAWPRRRRRIAAGVFLALIAGGMLTPAPYWWAAAIGLAAFILHPRRAK